MVVRVGFNEAPAFLPGKIRSRIRGCGQGGSCFNEAPAFLPGKIATAGGTPAPGFRFNEAPAFLPGKMPDLLDWQPPEAVLQ